jgi:hypothetical protein
MKSLSRHPRLFFLLFHLAVFLTLDQVAGAWTREDPPGDFRRAHPYYHHDLRPSVRAVTRWGGRHYSIVTNSLAFRDRTRRRVPARSEHRRILLMGDSFLEGVGVPWEESLAGRLARGAEGGTEVLNAGVIGYSPKTYLAKTRYLFERVGLRVDELVVFIDMSDIPNEIVYLGWEPRDEEAPPSAPSAFWSGALRNSLVLGSLRRLRARPRPEVIWNRHGMPFAQDLNMRVFRDPAFNEHDHWTLEYKYAKEGMELAAAHMGELADLCARSQVSLTLVIYPWPANVLARELDHPQVGLWSGFARERGLRLINLFPAFMPMGEDPEATVKRYYIPGDIHWNAAGHALAADHLIRAGLLR